MMKRWNWAGCRLGAMILVSLLCFSCASDDSSSGAPDGDPAEQEENDSATETPDSETPDADPAESSEEESLDADAEAEWDPGPDPGHRLRSEGWKRGDLHMHSTWSDGADSPAMVIAIAEYLENETFLAAHPEFAGNQLDFISITDHRTTAVVNDPTWTSDRLTLIPGQEFGSDGHANIWGLLEWVPHDPDGNGTTLADLVAAIETTHANQGAFSINHPTTPGDPWPWDTRTHDALEIWNTKWAMQSTPLPSENLTEWESSNGPASPLFKRALQETTGQILAFYEAMLARGVHVAVVGGSDRHMLFMNGFPTTWIQPDGEGSEGLVKGIRARHTFVSRTPVAATVEMSVTGGTIPARMGDAVTVPAGGTTVSLSLRVGRADGGLLRLIRGEAIATDEELAASPLGEVLAESPIVGADFRFDLADVAVKPGDWIYPVVLEPLYPPGISEEQRTVATDLARTAATMTGEDYAQFATIVLKLVDKRLLMKPEECDPAEWDPAMLQCLPLTIDGTPTSTFFLPDYVERAFSAVLEANGEITWCMGAVGSAVRFTE